MHVGRLPRACPYVGVNNKIMQYKRVKIPLARDPGSTDVAPRVYRPFLISSIMIIVTTTNGSRSFLNGKSTTNRSGRRKKRRSLRK